MKNIIRSAVFFFLLIIGIIIFLLSTRDEDPQMHHDVTPLNNVTDEPLEQESSVNENSNIIIDIKGAVVKPGVFQVPPESRVNDAIKLAGGFTTDADQSQVNLAQKVQDEMILNIPFEGEERNAQVQGGADQSDRVKINYATQEEIESLNGIGPSKAQAIIQYREEHGLFSKEEDLLQVPGIGEKTLSNFIDDILIP